MAAEKTTVLLIGPRKPVIARGLDGPFEVVQLPPATDREGFYADCAARVRGMAIAATSERIDGTFLSRFPKLEIVASFGVGYDHVDAVWAGTHGITVTNTPDVLTEEVADTAMGLLLCTVRELPQAERYLRGGRWANAPYRLTDTLHGKTAGVYGLGRIGKAIARRCEAFGLRIAYHGRAKQPVPYTYYASLVDLA